MLAVGNLEECLADDLDFPHKTTIVGAVGSLLAAHLRKHANDAVKVMTRTPDAYNTFIQGGNEITIERDGQQLCAEDIGCELVPRTRTITPAQFGHPFINAKTLAEQQDQDDGRQSQGNIDSLFVTTKAQSVLPAIHSIVPRMSARSTIVLLQNGGGLVDALIHDIFPEEHLRPNFIVGVNSHGVYKKSAGHIVDDTRHSNAHTVWAGLGSIPFAVMPNVHTQAAIAENATHPSANPLLNMSSTTPHPTLSHLPVTNDTKGLYATLSAMLSCTPLKFEWLRLPELLRIQQQKIAVNCVINPLTAIFDVQNGVILEPNLIEMARSICYEVSNVFAAQARNDLLRNARSGEEMQDEDKYIVSQGAFPPAHVLSYESLHARAMQVARLTDANLSSMLADIRHGAPETEM